MLNYLRRGFYKIIPLANKLTLLKIEFLQLKSEVNFHIRKINTKENTHLQNYLYFIHYPLFSFTESIIILCENNKSHVAKALLRSLFEAHINIIYHQLADSEQKLAISAKEGFDIKIKGVKEIQDLIRRYPNLKSKDPSNLFSEEWLKKALTWSETERQAIMKGNNLSEKDKAIDLKSKAIKCDKEYSKEAEKGHFERLYTIIYRQLSPPSHLNIERIQVFINQRETGEYLFSDGEDNNFIASEAIEVCVVFTKDLYEHGVIKGKIPNVVSRLEKLLKSK